MTKRGPQDQKDTLWLELELERRRPAPDLTTDAAEEAKPLLSGVTVTELHHDPDDDTEERARRAAAETARRMNNTHDCAEARGEGPCTHQDHFKDLAILRGDLMKLGLDDEEVRLSPRGEPRDRHS